MPRYIDAVIYVRVPEWQIGERVDVFFKDTMQVSGVCRRKPTADVRENVHAHWVAINDARHPYRCSNCGAEFDVETMMLKPLWNFCPNCGAQMDEVTE